MENQHRKITGYRELSATEIDLMNKIKAEGGSLDTLLKMVGEHLTDQYEACVLAADTGTDANPFIESEEGRRIAVAEPQRWRAIARTHFQEGLMALTRAVAQPGFF